MPNLNKKWILALPVLLLVVICSLFLLQKPVAEYAIKNLRFSFFVKNTSNHAVRNLDLLISVPTNDGRIQLLESSSLAQGMSFSRQGYLQKKIDLIPPFSSSKLTYLLKVKRANQAVKDHLSSESKYLIDEPYLNLTSEAVQSLAKNLKRSSARNTAKTIYQWIVNNISIGEYAEISKGAEYLLATKTGDCTDMMYLFVALARANGVAARSVRGLLAPTKSAVINATDFHDWAEFYDGQKWVLVDPQLRVFDKFYENYIELKLIEENNRLKRFSVNSRSVNIVFE